MHNKQDRLGFGFGEPGLVVDFGIAGAGEVGVLVVHILALAQYGNQRGSKKQINGRMLIFKPSQENTENAQHPDANR